MQGTLTVRSAPGEGANFALTLPLVRAEPVPEPSSEMRIAAQPELLSGYRVLVAEDNPVNQVLVRRLLERRGVEVVMADDGEQCVKMWQEERPDLILMDCQIARAPSMRA